MKKLVKAALAASLLGLLLPTTTWAQEDELSPCEEACYSIEDACYEACSDEAEPAACESTCTRNADVCAQQCED